MTTTVREKPILFNGPMVKAILEGKKTQTRRVVTPQFEENYSVMLPGWDWHLPRGCTINKAKVEQFADLCPFGQVGDHLWVKEAAYIAPKHFGDPDLGRCVDDEGDRRMVHYLADGRSEAAADYGIKPRPSMFMPRWASRLTLEIIEIRVQRLQDISAEDVQAEGVCPGFLSAMTSLIKDGTAASPTIQDFARLWDSINAKKHPWESNPFVWAITFRRVTP